MDPRAFERIAAPFGPVRWIVMFLRDEYTRTIKGDLPPSPDQGLPGFSPIGGEGDFGGRTGNWK